VPGDGGSQMDARLNKTKSVSYWCHKTTDWYTLWLDAEQLISWASSCWIDNIKLDFISLFFLDSFKLANYITQAGCTLRCMGFFL
jgi:hypothetical protein